MAMGIMIKTIVKKDNCKIIVMAMELALVLNVTFLWLYNFDDLNNGK